MKLFGMPVEELQRTAKAARAGDAAAIERLRAGSGTHVFGHKVDAKKLLAGAAVVGAAVATGGIAAGAVTLAGAATRKSDPPPPPTETPMVPQTLSTLGGSSGRSATPIVPSRSAGVIPGLIGVGIDWLRDRAGGGGSSGSLAPCPSGSRRVGSACIDLQPGGDVSGGGMLLSTGEVVRGRYGAAEVPEMESVRTHRCRKGLVLGDDNLCYRRGQLRKDERKWNPGTKPLFTGGDRNAVRRAAKVARAMQAQQSQLQSLGLMKRPKSRRQIELELRYGGKLRGK